VPFSFLACFAGFQDFLTQSACSACVWSHCFRNCVVFWSVRYPLPKSPYSSISAAISLSRSTFAMMEAAETMG